MAACSQQGSVGEAVIATGYLHHNLGDYSRLPHNKVILHIHTLPIIIAKVGEETKTPADALEQHEVLCAIIQSAALNTGQWVSVTSCF